MPPGSFPSGHSSQRLRRKPRPTEPGYRAPTLSTGETRSSAGTSTFDNVLTFTSACPECDATMAGAGGSITFQWIGGGWQSQTSGPICAGDTQTLTPTVVANGFVQELSYYYATCNGTVRSSTMTRTGD